MSKTILAIDIGSINTKAVIAEIDEFNEIKVLGHGIAKSQGVKKGIITNIDLASKSIRKAVNDARRIAGNNISSAVVSISSAYTKSTNSIGIVNIPQKDITIKEINRVMETALYNANIPKDYEVLHVLPYNFKVDEQTNIEDPYNMNASRMEVEAHIIIAQKSSLSNIKKAIISAGLELDAIVLDSYASAIATMSHDEKVLGVAVLDLGGQTSSITLFKGNSIRYNNYLPVGSNHITNDISIALHTPLEVAEKVKREFGNLLEVEDQILELPIIGDTENRNEIPLKIIQDVIVARVEELLYILSKYLDKSNLRDRISSGIILTGGMTKLKGIREFTQAIFPGLSVRIGYPAELKGLFDELKDPSNATVIGLLLYKAGKNTQYEIDNQKRLLHQKEELHDSLSDIKLDNIGSKKSKECESPPPRVNEQPVNIIFDDLPRIDDSSNSDFVTKVKNWIKQLF
ncbi:MAG: cell division protein FtsA [Epsilonproteobacteria bacterium]|nr:cell division protein FtsA [Campylobacterota bacterium]